MVNTTNGLNYSTVALVYHSTSNDASVVDFIALSANIPLAFRIDRYRQ